MQFIKISKKKKIVKVTRIHIKSIKKMTVGVNVSKLAKLQLMNGLVVIQCRYKYHSG